MSLIDVKSIRKADEALKPGGVQYDEDAIKLAQLFEDRSRALTTAYLKQRGLGRPNESTPIEVSILRRIVEALAVTYRTPPVRRLAVNGRELADANPSAQALAQVYARMSIDLHMQTIDVMRTLYRQVVVTYAESHAHGCAQLRVFEPFNVARKANPMAADTLEEDEAILLCVCAGKDDASSLYQAWLHADDGSWRCWVVDGRGELAEGVDQPYDEDGIPPFEGLPAQLIYDEHPRGRAYLPIPQSRVSFALAVNGLVADLAYLVQMESHTPMHLATDDTRGVPTETGPGKLWLSPADSRITALATNPKIAESGEVLDQLLRLWLTGETLPGDALKAGAPIVTGAALKVRERDLTARRQRQVALAIEDERRAYAKIAAVHNTFAEVWRLPELREDAELRVSIARQYVPADPKEVQDRMYRDIAIGAASVLDYIQERDGCDRDTAIRTWQRVQEDRALFPVGQTPGALVEDAGPLAALGPGSATKKPGEFNPELGTSTEGASVVDAVKRAG